MTPQLFFSSRRRHTRCSRDWSSDVCSSDLVRVAEAGGELRFAAKSLHHTLVSGERGMQDLDRHVTLEREVARAKIGRASCRERVQGAVVGGWVKRELGMVGDSEMRWTVVLG